MLEHLVNEEQELAKEVFHQIVVEKSRQIYETILSEDFDVEEAKDEEDEEPVDEATKDEDDEEVDEDFAFGEADDEPTDDESDDTDTEMNFDNKGGDSMSMDDEEGSEDLEDRVVDLEDAIDDLRAEFEKMMGDEDDMDMDDEGDMDIGGDATDDLGADLEMDDDEKMGEVNFMREYIEKVGGADYTKYGKMGDNGVNTKSTVAGKNDMGGTTANIAKGGESTKGGTQGGLANPSVKDINSGNVNVPGGNAGKTAFKKKEPGHGAEKKGTGDNGDSGADSPINGVKSRAK